MEIFHGIIICKWMIRCQISLPGGKASSSFQDPLAHFLDSNSGACSANLKRMRRNVQWRGQSPRSSSACHRTNHRWSKTPWCRIHPPSPAKIHPKVRSFWVAHKPPCRNDLAAYACVVCCQPRMYPGSCDQPHLRCSAKLKRTGTGWDWRLDEIGLGHESNTNDSSHVVNRYWLAKPCTSVG